MPFPELNSSGTEGGHVAPAVACNDLERAVVVHVLHDDLGLHLPHLDGPPRHARAVLVENVDESNARSNNNLRLSVRVEVRHGGRAVHVGLEVHVVRG